jgi:hypothetical protein
MNEFFAVTATSVYHVAINGSTATKIALRGESRFGIGHRLSGGSTLAVGKQLFAYTPEGGGMTSYQRDPDLVNIRWWGETSSDIVALFESRTEAYECFDQVGHQPYDARWLEKTSAVIEKIGDDHPTLYICRSGRLALPLPLPVAVK